MNGLEIVKQKQAHHFITKMKGKGRSPLQVNTKDVITVIYEKTGSIKPFDYNVEF